MLYFILLLLALIAFILVKNRRVGEFRAFAWVLGFYLLAFMTMILYLSKDFYYYNVISNYFQMPKFIWKNLFFLNIPKPVIIRLLNFSTLGIIYSSLHFTLTLYSRRNSKLAKRCRIAALIYVVLMSILYDPFVHLQSYYLLYPDYLSVQAYNSMLDIFHKCTQAFNVLLILGTVCAMFIHCFLLPQIRALRLYKLFLAFCYLALCVCYCFLLSFSPAYYLSISKIAQNFTFRSIPLYNNPLIYNAIPYFLTLFILLIFFGIYKISKISRVLDDEDKYIERQISASETTSKVFCHYIKNEILAIQSQIEMLPQNEENMQLLQNSIERCVNLYQRIDSIHRTTKTHQLTLRFEDLRDLIAALIEEFKTELIDCRVDILLPDYEVKALIDAEYFKQALHNLVRNALDAMDALPPQKKHLMVQLQTADKWIVLSVMDTGIGIAPENLSNIFTPFFSSSSFSKHWGVGLSLTYKIIQAHEGKIDVQSKPGAGTTFRIILPNIVSPRQQKDSQKKEYKYR